ncbi:MAG: Asp23/Gls24 family envelope stress response protein [Candidatus Promineifilaceae bacterium]
MPTRDESLGQIDISTTAIATIAEQAINQSYGVVGMASKSIVDGIARLLTRDSHRGIDVTMEDGDVIIDVYVIIEHGMRIRAVAESIQHTTKFHVEKVLGLPVRAVNVYVQGLRLSNNVGAGTTE